MNSCARLTLLIYKLEFKWIIDCIVYPLHNYCLLLLIIYIVTLWDLLTRCKQSLPLVCKSVQQLFFNFMSVWTVARQLGALGMKVYLDPPPILVIEYVFTVCGTTLSTDFPVFKYSLLYVAYSFSPRSGLDMYELQTDVYRRNETKITKFQFKKCISIHTFYLIGIFNKLVYLFFKVQFICRNDLF